MGEGILKSHFPFDMIGGHLYIVPSPPIFIKNFTLLKDVMYYS